MKKFLIFAIATVVPGGYIALGIYYGYILRKKKGPEGKGEGPTGPKD